jgi:hypothetical protein
MIKIGKGGQGKNIPSTSMLKSSILLSHTKLPLRISNNILIGVRLRKRDC